MKGRPYPARFRQVVDGDGLTYELCDVAAHAHSNCRCGFAVSHTVRRTTFDNYGAADGTVWVRAVGCPGADPPPGHNIAHLNLRQRRGFVAAEPAGAA